MPNSCSFSVYFVFKSSDQVIEMLKNTLSWIFQGGQTKLTQKNHPPKKALSPPVKIAFLSKLQGLDPKEKIKKTRKKCICTKNTKNNEKKTRIKVHFQQNYKV